MNDETREYPGRYRTVTVYARADEGGRAIFAAIEHEGFDLVLPKKYGCIEVGPWIDREVGVVPNVL